MKNCLLYDWLKPIPQMSDKKTCKDGKDGKSPYIGSNGNWYEWGKLKCCCGYGWIDTGVKASCDCSITVKQTNTIPYGEDASVINDGTDTDVQLVFNIPEGEPGANGITPTFEVLEVTKLPSTSQPTVELIEYPENNYNFEFGIPSGKGIKSVSTTGTASNGDYINTVTYDDLTTDTFNSPIGPAGSVDCKQSMISISSNGSIDANTDLSFDTSAINICGQSYVSINSNYIVLGAGCYSVFIDFTGKGEDSCVNGKLSLLKGASVYCTFGSPASTEKYFRWSGSCSLELTNNTNIYIKPNVKISTSKNYNNAYNLLIIKTK